MAVSAGAQPPEFYNAAKVQLASTMAARKMLLTVTIKNAGQVLLRQLQSASLGSVMIRAAQVLPGALRHAARHEPDNNLAECALWSASLAKMHSSKLKELPGAKNDCLPATSQL